MQWYQRILNAKGSILSKQPVYMVIYSDNEKLFVPIECVSDFRLIMAILNQGEPM